MLTSQRPAKQINSAAMLTIQITSVQARASSFASSLLSSAHCKNAVLRRPSRNLRSIATKRGVLPLHRFYAVQQVRSLRATVAQPQSRHRVNVATFQPIIVTRGWLAAKSHTRPFELLCRHIGNRSRAHVRTSTSFAPTLLLCQSTKLLHTRTDCTCNNRLTAI